jgi:hypothetical protein
MSLSADPKAADPKPTDPNATAAQATLLSQSTEAFQTVPIGNGYAVLSVLDATADLPSQFTAGPLWLFAENVVLTAPLLMNSGVVVAHSLASGTGEPARLSIAGRLGTSEKALNKSTNPGVTGGRGDDAKTLSVYLESTPVDTPGLRIDALGGNGGDGQRGDFGSPGGGGGNGGNGGHVTVAACVPVLAWLAQLRVVAALSSQTARAAGLTDLLASIPATDRLAPARDALQEAAKASGAEDQRAAMEQAAQALAGLSSDVTTALKEATDVRGGTYGAYGDGAPNGTSGTDGTAGGLTTVLVGTPAALAATTFPAFFIAHPSQVARLLDLARLRYLVLDPVGHPAGVRDLMTTLLRVQARTRPFVEAPANSPLLAHYRANEATIGAFDSVAQLQALYDQATRLINQLRQGKDLFGYSADHVPLGSFGFYQELLDKMIADFITIEKAYNEHFTELKANSATMEAIKSARTQQEAVRQTAENELPALETLALKTASIIDGYQVTLPPLRNALDKAIKDLTPEITDKFHFDPEQLVTCLSTLAFAPESGFMIAAQAGTFLYQGSTKITNNEGVPVRTEYLVGQVQAVQATVDGLTNGYAQLDNGTLAPDDPNAAKLVAEQQALETLLAGFDKQFTKLEDLKTAFDAYVNKVVERNNQILTYNATILLMLRDRQLIAQSEANLEVLTDEQLSTLKPDLPALTTFVSQVYYAARSQVMETLDLTARAFRFWALSDVNLLTKAYGKRTPPKIDGAALIAARETILSGYQQAVEEFGTEVSVFPPSTDGAGIIIDVPDDLVQLLPITYEMLVDIPAATPHTKAASSPFATMANVRVLLARVWIDGIKTADGMVRVRVTHTGPETIVDPAGNQFTFRHQPIDKLFRYSAVTGEIKEEASFGCRQETPRIGQHDYAAVGPFTTWHIQVKPDDHKGLDLSGVTGVRLEFQGTHLRFP